MDVTTCEQYVLAELEAAQAANTSSAGGRSPASE